MTQTPHSKTRSKKRKSTYDYLFKPRSIAVVGASNDALKPGGRVIKNIKDHHYQGDLWAVNPKSASILGLPTYVDIAALPAAPDLAIVAIPSALVLPAVEALAEKGAGAVVVLTSGFGEKDAQGKALEERMLAVAGQAGMTLIGPNCSGFLTQTYKGKFAGIIPAVSGAAVDFISGSGATVDYVMEQATFRGLSFGKVVNLGNSIQMGVEDILALYDRHYDEQCARVLMLYLESVKKPGLLLRHAQNLARKGCAIAGIKSGVTAAGERAAASHTGAIATSDAAVQALFDKAGITRVKSKSELIDVGCILASAGGRLPGRRACIITDAGGPGVLLSDELNRQGWELPLLSDATQQKLKAILPPESAVGNPIDCLPSRTAGQIGEVLGVLAQEEKERIDAIAIILGDSGMSDNAAIFKVIGDAAKDHPIPLLPVLSSFVSSRQKIDTFTAAGNTYFFDEVSVGTALGKIGATPLPEAPVSTVAGYDRDALDSLLKGAEGILPPETVSAVLKAAGFLLPAHCEVRKKEDLAAACRQVGYPLAIKVIGPLHKTDAGGVRLGIAGPEAAEQAWTSLMQLPEAQGVVLQTMVAGIEVILGASREGDFGHLLMVGLGGIYAEVLKDVQFALAPVGDGESRRMIRRLKSCPILEGFRGEPGVCVDCLAACIQRIGLLVRDFPRIRELDVNPLKGTGEQLYAIDARIILDG